MDNASSTRRCLRGAGPLTVAAATCISLLTPAAPARAATGVPHAATELVSGRADGTSTSTWTEAQTTKRAVSADGRFIAFASGDDRLVANDGNGVTDVFVRDRQAGTVIRVSSGSAGGDANGASTAPSITPDGRYLAFNTYATNIASGPGVVVKDMSTGRVEVVSVPPPGRTFTAVAPNGVSISDDGRYVTFTARPDDDSGHCWSGPSQVYVRDRSAQSTSLVSEVGGGPTTDGCSGAGMISGNGRTVTFESSAPSITGQRIGTYVMAKTLASRRTVVVSVADDGSPVTAYGASITGDGRYVALSTWDCHSVSPANAPNGCSFVRDLRAPTMTPVSRTSAGAVADSSDVTISSDGSTVAYVTREAAAVSVDRNAMPDVIVRTVATGAQELASVSEGGWQEDWEAAAPAVSATGRFVAFTSLADNLVPGATDGRLYLRDRSYVAAPGDPAPRVDATPPVTTLAYDDGYYRRAVSDGMWLPGPTGLVPLCTDKASGCSAVTEASVDGRAPTTAIAATEEGMHQYAVSTYDLAGNREVGNIVHIGVDTSSPQVAMVTPSGTYHGPYITVTLEVKASDLGSDGTEGSGLQKVFLARDGYAQPDCTYDAASGTWKLTQKLLAGSTYRYTPIAWDRAGWWAIGDTIAITVDPV